MSFLQVLQTHLLLLTTNGIKIYLQIKIKNAFSANVCVYVCIIFGCLKFYFIQKKKNWFTICIFSSSCITSFDSISGKFYLYNLFQIFLYFLFEKKKKILSENWFLFIWQCSVLTSWVEQNIPPSSFFPSKYNWIYKNGFHSFIICLEVDWSILEEYKKSVHNSKKKKKNSPFFLFVSNLNGLFCLAVHSQNHLPKFIFACWLDVQ